MQMAQQHQLPGLGSITLPGTSSLGINTDFKSMSAHESSPISRRLSYPPLTTRTIPQFPTHPATPPESLSGSPKLTSGESCSSHSLSSSPLPRIARIHSPSSSSPIRLPSLDEFDQGVEALARRNPPRPRKSRLAERRKPCNRLFAPGPFPSYLLPNSQDQQQQTQPSTPVTYQGYSPSSQGLPPPSYMDGYPSPPPELESRRINQKYSVEEGDYIIYAWHDKKLKWTRIEQEFADLFGRVPKRTASGLQAWYYRMNQKIPVWDADGWLIFDDEDDLEARSISIKCRESQDRPLGLAERYPERAIQYHWVDPELKAKARDWATKRAIQYHSRKEKRRLKEQALPHPLDTHCKL